MRRVVVTGLGLVTPLATGVEETWSRLIAGKSGAGPITRFDTTGYATTYACELKRGDGSDGTFNPDDWMEPKEQRKVDEFILYGMAAADQAIRDSGWEPKDTDSQERTGCLIGSGIGGLSSIADTSITLNEKGPRRVSPFFVPGALINLISGQVSIRYGFKGPNHAVVTACSTGRARHRGRRAADPVGRCGRDGCGRRGEPDLRDRHRGVQRLQGPVHEAPA
jgi:3-oxoacyl-[acyl-carrier-protein] synthase II